MDEGVGFVDGEGMVCPEKDVINEGVDGEISLRDVEEEAVEIETKEEW